MGVLADDITHRVVAPGRTIERRRAGCQAVRHEAQIGVERRGVGVRAVGPDAGGGGLHRGARVAGVAEVRRQRGGGLAAGRRLHLVEPACAL